MKRYSRAAGLLRELDDLFAVGDRGRHRHGAGDVLASLEGLDRLRGVIGDRGVDVHRVDFRIAE
jgi:hypothetical protein